MYSNVVAAAAELASGSCCRVKWSKRRKMYECTRCGYASERKSNVGRHFRRIHCELKKHKVCVVCEKKFSTKGEFYEHCEKEHPHLRNSCFITSEKYKIGKKENRRRRNQARSSQKTPAKYHKRASIDETSEEETSDSTFCDNDNENIKRVEEDPVESEEIEEQESFEELKECQGDEEKSQIEQENIEPLYDVQNSIDNVERVYINPYQEEDLQKVIVQEISQLYAPIPYPTPDNDDSSSWSHKANESISSPVRSLRTDLLSPILWTPTSYKLPTTPSSSTESDECTSSPARTIKTDDYIFSPARSLKTDDSVSSSASSVASDDYLSSPVKVYKPNELISSTTMTPNAVPSNAQCLPKAASSPSCSNAAMKVNTFPSLSTLPLKKRFGNLIRREHLADITNMQNNEFNVKSGFNNNEMQVANRNFTVVSQHQQAFFTNIDFDDLEAVLILKSLKESNY